LNAARNPTDGTGMMGVATGVGAFGGAMSGMEQPVDSSPGPDPVAILAQLKAMFEQGLVTADQYAAKQEEVPASDVTTIRKCPRVVGGDI
jgi:hypothetical protein